MRVSATPPVLPKRKRARKEKPIDLRYRSLFNKDLTPNRTAKRVEERAKKFARQMLRAFPDVNPYEIAWSASQVITLVGALWATQRRYVANEAREKRRKRER